MSEQGTRLAAGAAKADLAAVQSGEMDLCAAAQ
jgi:hypothetical protein